MSQKPPNRLRDVPPAERRVLAEALLDRPTRREDGLAELRERFPDLPESMLYTAAHHLYGDGPDACIDYLAEVELTLRDKSCEVGYGSTWHLLYHVYNWLQFKALLPEGKQDLEDLVDEVAQLLDEDDIDAAKQSLDELRDIVQGTRSPPDFEPL